MTTYHLAHMESAANTVVGIIIGQSVLFAFGIPALEAIPITMIIIALSYVRSFVLRLAFRQIELRQKENAMQRFYERAP